MKRTAIVFVGFLVVLGMLGASTIALAGGEPPGTEYRITDGTMGVSFPAIYGNRIVWNGDDGIYQYYLGEDGVPNPDDDTTEYTEQVGSPAAFEWIRIHGDRIAFMRDLGNEYVIDLTTGVEYPVGDPDANLGYWSPDIWGNNMVYTSWPEGQATMMFHNFGENGVPDILGVGDDIIHRDPSGLWIIDISDPSNPVEVGSCDTPDWTSEVYVSDTLAYVAAWDAGLRVMDMSDPSNPVEVGSCDTPDWAWEAHISGSYAYVAAAGAGLRVIDISNPSGPTEVGSCETPGYAHAVYVLGSYAYVATERVGLCVIDISTPSSPTPVASYDAPSGCAFDVYVSGYCAYLGCARRGNPPGGLYIINVTDPENPTEVGFYETGWAFGVYVSDTLAYVASGQNGLQILDVSDPSNPTKVGSCATSGDAQGVYVSGSYAYVAASGAGVDIIDVTDPENPTEVGFYDTPGSPHGVYVSDGLAYVADGGKPPNGQLPRIWENQVVGHLGGDIFVYTLDQYGAPASCVSLGKQNAQYPSIWGNSVVWEDSRNGNSDIYMHDLVTREETAIATGRKGDVDPEIHGSNIAYRGDFEDGVRKGRYWWKSNVYVHDLLTGDTHKLTNSSKGVYPDVFENKIVYRDTRDDVTDIYLFILDSGGPPPPPGVMHVDSIDMSLKQTGPFTNAIAKVKIVDESDAPVPQATVEGHWSGLTTDTDVFETGSDGFGECSSDRIKNASGCFIFTVDTLYKDGWDYDSTANVQTADTICTGGDGGQSAGIGPVQPQVFTLSQSCPDPFSERTTISFTLPASGHTTLQVCDISGRIVATLVDGKTGAGQHAVTWEADNTPSGIYFYRLTAGELSATRKMLVLK